MMITGKIYDTIIYGLAVIAGLAMTMIFVFVIQDTILRNLYISPPPWSPPMTEYAMLYVTLLSAPWLVRTRGHILLEVLRQRLNASAARRLEIAVYIFCIAICLILSWHAITLWVDAFFSGEEDHRGIDIPYTYLYGPAAIAFPLMVCEFARYLFGKESIYQGGVAGSDGV